MKLFRIAATALLLHSAPSHSAVFEAYKDVLETTAVCRSYPRLDLPMHVQMLKETGAISASSSLKADGKFHTFKAAPGLAVYGLPLVSIGMGTGNATYGPALAITVKASASQLAQAAADNARKFSKGTHFQADFPKHFTWSGGSEETPFELTISEAPGGLSTLTCGPFAP